MCGSTEFAERPLDAADGWIYTYGTSLDRKVLWFLFWPRVSPRPLGTQQVLYHSGKPSVPFSSPPHQPPKPNTHAMNHKEMGLNTQTKPREELGTIKKIQNIKP